MAEALMKLVCEVNWASGKGKSFVETYDQVFQSVAELDEKQDSRMLLPNSFVLSISSIVPKELGPSFQPGNFSLSHPSGVSCGNRKSIARRDSICRRRSLLNEVPVTSSFQQNQQELLAFPIEVTPIMQEDGNSTKETRVSFSESEALVAGPKQPQEKW
ncbi:hypothetical protein RHGRI_012439 [Rhododendron griersonianum]|uniref:Uncharacterized protein n=1 Tax=Rhododendron griersonianum TaxID=479676 RepID=A0AAV6KQJ9_9ERIC|nr:hypothetical protein RHGRI_012439 [Rhododendron griersonianum]